MIVEADEVFLRQFETCTLPFEQWKHCAHVKVAYLYLRKWPFPEALDHVRTSIRRYNAATNTPEALERGYHETITQAWMRLVSFALSEHGPAADAEAFLHRHPELATPGALRFFYSRERLISWRAKGEFVEPDLAPFPRSSKPPGEAAFATAPAFNRQEAASPP